MPRSKVFRIELNDTYFGNRQFITRNEDGRVWCELASGIPASLHYAGVPSGKESETEWALKNAKNGKAALAIIKAVSNHSAKLITG